MLIIARFAFTYTQSMTMKKLEMRVTRNIKVHLLREVFEKEITQLQTHIFILGN